MPKSKKKRNKPYRKRRVGYMEQFDIAGNQKVSDKTLEGIELSYRVHLDSFRREPTDDSWSYLVGVILMADRLSYAIEEGADFRRNTTAAWRQLHAAWRIWTEKQTIATQNLQLAEDILPDVIALFRQFTYNECDQSLQYVLKHDLCPVEIEKQEATKNE